MPNKDAPRGLHPTRHANGAPYSGATTRYFRPASDSAAVFIGDPVIASGSGDAEGVPGCVIATPGSGITGAVVGVQNLTSDNLSRQYLPADTAGYLLVADDPGLEFEVQEDSDGSALAAADIGLNANLIIGSGNTTTGVGATELDSSSKAATATLDVRILGLVQRPDNEIGNNAKWRVRLNAHSLTNTTGA